jgi:hypothetical protein
MYRHVDLVDGERVRVVCERVQGGRRALEDGEHDGMRLGCVGFWYLMLALLLFGG